MTQPTEPTMVPIDIALLDPVVTQMIFTIGAKTVDHLSFLTARLYLAGASRTVAEAMAMCQYPERLAGEVKQLVNAYYIEFSTEGVPDEIAAQVR